MTCKACAGTGVITSSDSIGMVDQYACDLCATDVCEHGIRAPHECKQCADEPSDAEIATFMASRQPPSWVDIPTVDDLTRFYLSRLPAIREAAEAHGYAIGVHGSLQRDFDLIAAPWRDGATDADTLAHAVAQAACGIDRAGTYDWEQKPAGRLATSIPICWPAWHGQPGAGHIDLSVMPAIPVLSQGTAQEQP